MKESYRDTSKFNLGLQNKDLGRALSNALQEADKSYKTEADYQSYISEFADFLKDEQEIRDLRDVEKSDVIAFTEHLSERYENGEIDAGATRNALSAVNTVMSQARGDNNCRVTGDDHSLPSRSQIATSDKSLSQQDHNALKEQVTDRLSSQLDLMRDLGLRFKESCLIDAKQCLKQAETTGSIVIDRGTKGGRSREIPITSSQQIKSLKTASEIQGNHRSMIPLEQRFKSYQQQCYSEIKNSKVGFHSERHAYANSRYEQLTGVRSPVQSGIKHGKNHIAYLSEKLGVSKQQAKEIDKTARLQVAEELGHSRTSITNNYLG